MIDSKRCLHCLSLKLALRFTTISSSPSFSQMIRGITGSTSVTVSVPMEDESDVESGLVLDAEEDAKEAEVKGDASDRVDTF